MNVKIEKQLEKIKELDKEMLNLLEQKRINNEKRQNIIIEGNTLEDKCATTEKSINIEKERLFELLRNEK